MTCLECHISKSKSRYDMFGMKCLTNEMIRYDMYGEVVWHKNRIYDMFGEVVTNKKLEITCLEM